MQADRRSGGRYEPSFAAALKSPRGNLTWIVVNDAPRRWVTEFSLKGCSRPALYKYQVTGEQRNRPELKINPLRKVEITAGNAGFSDEIPPTSVTIYSTWDSSTPTPGSWMTPPVNDNYSSPSATIKSHQWRRFSLFTVSSSCCLSLTLWASPFGGAESLAPSGAQDVAEPKGLAGAPG